MAPHFGYKNKEGTIVPIGGTSHIPKDSESSDEKQTHQQALEVAIDYLDSHAIRTSSITEIDDQLGTSCETNSLDLLFSYLAFDLPSPTDRSFKPDELPSFPPNDDHYHQDP